MDDGQLTRDLKHIDALVFVPGPLLERLARLKNIAEYAASAVSRASFADLSDADLGLEYAVAVDAIHYTRVTLQRDWSDANESALVAAHTCLRHVRAEALRRGVTL